MDEKIQSETDCESELAELVSELTDLLQRDTRVDFEAFISQHPDFESRLRQLWPSLKAIASMDALQPNSQGTIGGDSKPEQLGDFRIIQEIGRGGMGVVYEAQQLSMGRKVAVKVLPFAALLDERQLQRFKNEARAAGALHHPNIVPVFSVGTERGVHFYAMQLVHGPSLAEVLHDLHITGSVETVQSNATASHHSRPAAPLESSSNITADTRRELHALLSTQRSRSRIDYYRTVARWGKQIAEAISYAHQNGVIHRDIKPANLLLDQSGNLLVTDFGLARLQGEASASLTGDIVGTLRYMAPEQALADRELVDHRVDIYSLAVTLYEMVADRPIFPGQHREAILKQIAFEEPIPPTRFDSSLPADLETIILKAASKSPADRYSSAKELADDLDRFLTHKSIKAKRPSYRDRIRKWAQRHPSAVVTGSILALLVTTGSLAGFLWTTHTNKQLAEAEKVASAEATRAFESLELARDVVDTFYLQLGTQWIADDTAPTTFQSAILKEAAKFYQNLSEIGELRNDTLHGLELIASGHERSAQIQHYLQDFEAARVAGQKSIDAVSQMLRENQRDPRLRSKLSQLYISVGQSLVELARYDEAGRAYDQAKVHTEQLIADGISPLDHRYQHSLIQLAQAALRMNEQHLHEVEDLATSAKDELVSIARAAGPHSTLWQRQKLDRHRAQYLIARAAAYQGNVTKASQVCEESREHLKLLKTVNHDLDQVHHLQVDFEELAAEIAALSGNAEVADDLYRRALAMRQKRFRAGLPPDQFMMEAAFAKTTNFDGQVEVGPFCEYLETDMRRAILLDGMGRPYAAEEILGHCRAVTQVLVLMKESPTSLRSQVAHANSWALAARVLVDSRPSEARLLVRRAREVWLEANEQFNHAKRFVSGVYGYTPDWERFLKIAENVEQQTPPSDIPAESSSEMRTVFVHHSNGLSFASIGSWAAAGTAFRMSLEARTSDPEYDWIQLALVYAHEGRDEESNAYLKMTKESLDAKSKVDPELVEVLKAAEVTLIRQE